MTMANRDINYLLKKYKTKQPGEKFVSNRLKVEYNNKEWRLAAKIRTCKYVMDELNIQGTNRERCLEIVRTVPFKELHRQASCETIITSICFYIKKLETPQRRTFNYSVCKEYGVNEEIFSLIISRLCDYYQRNSLLKARKIKKSDKEVDLIEG